jgi:hypothetical protein
LDVVDPGWTLINEVFDNFNELSVPVSDIRDIASKPSNAMYKVAEMRSGYSLSDCPMMTVGQVEGLSLHRIIDKTCMVLSNDDDDLLRKLKSFRWISVRAMVNCG